MFELLLKVKRFSNSNTGFGIFSSGNIGVSGATDKYYFDSNTVAASTLLGSNTKTNMMAISGPEYGVFAGGNGSVKTTTKYTYIGDAVSSGTSLIEGGHSGCGVGNSVFGIITSNSGQSCQKYTYATEIVALATKLSSVGIISQNTAFGNAAMGLFCGGMLGSNQISSIIKYDYASNVVSTRAGLGTNMSESASAGNAELGYVCGGYGDGYSDLFITKVVRFANNTVSAGSNLNRKYASGSAAGNSSNFVIGGGSGTVVVTTKVNLITNAIVAGSNLLYARSGANAISSAYGGF